MRFLYYKYRPSACTSKKKDITRKPRGGHCKRKKNTKTLNSLFSLSCFHLLFLSSPPPPPALSTAVTKNLFAFSPKGHEELTNPFTKYRPIVYLVCTT